MRNDQVHLKSTSSSPTTELILGLASDDEIPGDAPPLREFRAPKLPQRITEGPISADSSDPLTEFVWSRTDWSKGGAFLTEDRGQGGYEDAVGVDARFEGSLGLGMARDSRDLSGAFHEGTAGNGTAEVPMNWLVRNGHAEYNAFDGWTNGPGGLLAVNASGARTGNLGFIANPTSASAGDVLGYVELANHTVYQGKKLSASMWVGSDTSGEFIHLQIDDGVGTTNSTETGSDGGTETPGTQVDVQRTIDASATRVRLNVVLDSNISSSTTFGWDDVTAMPYQTLGDDMGKCYGLARLGSDLYGAWGNTVAKWNETDDVWEAVYIHSSADATDIIEYQGNILVAFGASTAYIYGSDTSWTVSTEAGNDKYAINWAKARNAAGADALWKSETTTSVASSTDPTNGGGTWSAPLTVGDTNRTITRLYGAFDTLVVGKEDGLWSYVRWDIDSALGDNLFQNELPTHELEPDTANFAQGSEYQGWLYLTLKWGAIRWRPGQAQTLSHKFIGARTAFAGFVKGIMPTTFGLFMSANDRLVDFDPETGTPHTIDDLNTDNYGVVTPEYRFGAVLPISGNPTLILAGEYTGAGGATIAQTTDTPASIRWAGPATHPAPYLDTASGSRAQITGYIDLPVWYGSVPGDEKAFLSATIIGTGISSTETIKLQFGVNGASPTTTTLGTFNGTGAVQTKYFHGVTNPETAAVGYSIQPRLTFTRSDDVNEHPRLFSLIIRSTLRPVVRKTWEMYVRVESDADQGGPYQSPDSIQTVKTRLDTLEAQTYPIVMLVAEDDQEELADGTEYTAHIIDRDRVSEGSGFEIHRLLLQEAITSA